MKTKPAILSFLFSIACIFSATAFAQPDSGGGQECAAYSFKKNNGGGKCQGDAVVNVVFSPMPLPGNIPLLTAIYYIGQPLPKRLQAQGYLVRDGAKANISYCLSDALPKKNSFGNISAAGKLILEFTYPDGTVCRTSAGN